MIKTVVAAIIMKDGKVLIGKRKEGYPMAHKWEFPGGKMEPGETPERCLKRELKEELGVTAEIGPFFASGMSGKDSPHKIELLVYRASFRAHGPLELNEHEELRWVSPPELGEYDFPEADRPVVKKLIETTEGAYLKESAPHEQDPSSDCDEPQINRWQVSRAARNMLIDADESPDGRSPYILQLALWAIRTGKREVEDAIRETLNAIPDWRPERIMNFLLLREEHEEYEPAGWRETKGPLDLANLIIDDMEQKMAIHFPWYRSIQ